MRVAASILVLLAALSCRSEAQPAAGVPAEVTGQITAIDRGDDGGIAAFTVESDGQRYQIRLDPQRDYGFDLEHLEEHRAAGDPVRVTLERREGVPYAVSILDA